MESQVDKSQNATACPASDHWVLNEPPIPKQMGFVIYLGLRMHQFQKYCQTQDTKNEHSLIDSNEIRDEKRSEKEL